MNGRKAKLLRKQAYGMATDKRGLQSDGQTVFHPPGSARAIYQRLKKEERTRVK